MKATQILYKGLFPALSVLLASFPAQALVLSQANLAATTRHDSNLVTPGEINSVFGSSCQHGLLLWNSQADKGGDAELEDAYLWYFEPSVNGGTSDHIAGGAAADCPHCILFVELGDGVPVRFLYDLGSWDGMERMTLSGFRSETEDDMTHVAIWAGLKHTTEPGVLTLMSLGILGLVFSGKRKGV
jgi:hypothetical protein